MLEIAVSLICQTSFFRAGNINQDVCMATSDKSVVCTILSSTRLSWLGPHGTYRRGIANMNISTAQLVWLWS